MVNVVVTDNDFPVADSALMARLHHTQPWKASPHYFRSVKVSVLAALQMLSHADRGKPNVMYCNSRETLTVSQPAVGEERRENWFEVMGLLLGHFRENELIVTSTFALPVDASEVECSMNEASQMYMLEYLQYHQRTGTGVACRWGNDETKGSDEGVEEAECCVGWYHSHPGYTCFLSGTDVATQKVGQAAQDPWLAIVVDPVRAIATGKVEMRAFRTLPEGLTNRDARGDGVSSDVVNAPTQLEFVGSQVKDYGIHVHCYYELPITLVRTQNDEGHVERILSQNWVTPLTERSLKEVDPATAEHIHRIVTSLGGVSRALERKENSGGKVRGTQWEPSGFEVGESGVASIPRTSILDAEQLNHLAETLALGAEVNEVVEVVKSVLFMQ